MPRNSSKPRPTPTVTTVLFLIFSTVVCHAQTAASPAWVLLRAGLKQKSSKQRTAAVRVLGLISRDPEAADLAEKALRDPNSSVRAAAATALGQMHSSAANASLKQALNDKNLSVVMAAAHALHLLNDPACYDAYYEIFTGERKNNTSMIAQEMKVLRDPQQLAAMGFNEGIGYVPFASMGWEAYQRIMKDKKDGAAAKAALITALATDPEDRTRRLLLKESQNRNWVLRIAALEAIAKRGQLTLLPGVEPRLLDRRREVRLTAAAAVIQLEDAAQVPVPDNTKVAEASQAVSVKELPATKAVFETGK